MEDLKTTLVAVGISGSGKSTCLDILSNQANTFLHTDTPDGATLTIKSVTMDNFFDNTNNIDPTSITLIDCPGQCDPDSKKEEKNQIELISALEIGHVQKWLYVLSPVNGRITSSDVEAYQRVIHCFGVKSSSILGIVNKDPSINMSVEEAKVYKDELMQVFVENNMHASSWYFIPLLDLSISVPHDEKYGIQYSSPQVATVKDQLKQKISELRAEEYRLIREMQTSKELERRENEIKIKREQELVAQRMTERINAARFLQQEEEVRQQVEETQAEEKKKQEDLVRQQIEAEQKIVLQQAEEARRIAVINAQCRPVKCEESRGNPCQRYNYNYTVGHVNTNGIPYFNCKNAGNKHHEPRHKDF